MILITEGPITCTKWSKYKWSDTWKCTIFSGKQTKKFKTSKNIRYTFHTHLAWISNYATEDFCPRALEAAETQRQDAKAESSKDPLKLQSIFKTLAFLNSSNALIVVDNEHEDTKKLVK